MRGAPVRDDFGIDDITPRRDTRGRRGAATRGKARIAGIRRNRRAIIRVFGEDV